MKTRSHSHQETFSASPERIFDLLITPSSIRNWWGAARAIVIPQEGGMWAAAWGPDEDSPDYITSAVIATFDRPHCLVLDNYRNFAKSGAVPLEVFFVTEFQITSDPAGSRLKVIQDGFPAGKDGEEFLRVCEKGWIDTFAGIRKFLSAV